MDSDQFHAPPTTTAALKAFYRRYGALAAGTAIELVHFRDAPAIASWLEQWRAASQATASLPPVFGFSCYTWNVAEFLELAGAIKAAVPEALLVAGGPHVQQAEDYLGCEPFDLIFLGEGEETFQEFLDAEDASTWSDIAGLAFLRDGHIVKTAPRDRCRELDRFPSPLSELTLADEDGNPLYDAISYETSRGCPFRCAFCEWGTGAIGGRMYQWSLERIEEDWRQIAAAGIEDLWLADSNFGALKQDLAKAELIVELKATTGYPRTFATSWSKKHSRQVQQIALLLHRHQLLPHYQLALQTLTPEALRLSNRDNMSSNQYEPIAKRMAEEGVPIAAELIWGLPGDNLPDFERNLDRLLATFPNINIFGYTLLPGTEFYERREEYRIQAIPVAGYGKARGEYVVGSHSFDREQGEEGYFLITAHTLLVHGHIMPFTVRYLALLGSVPVSSLLRRVLRCMIEEFSADLPGFAAAQRMHLYENRNRVYLVALAERQRLFKLLEQVLLDWLAEHDSEPALRQRCLKVLQLDRALCPRTGPEIRETLAPGFDAGAVHGALAAMDIPAPADFQPDSRRFALRHPGGVGDILHDADGGSWLRGELSAVEDVVQVVSVA